MKINIYRLEVVKEKNEYKTFEYFKNEISTQKYIKIGSTINNGGLYYDLFVEQKPRFATDWLNELPKLFHESVEQFNLGSVYNGILTIRRKEKSEPIYAIALGHSFHVIQEHSDYNFAMDFAEKEISNVSITSKSSDFIQSNKIRSLLNIKSDFLTSTEGGESYKFIKGKPKFEGYGSTVECGYSIHFPLNYRISKVEDLELITKLITNIESSLKNPDTVSSFPRITYLWRSDEKNDVLDSKLLTILFDKNDEDDFEVYTSDFDVIGSNIIFNDNSAEYILFLKSKKTDKYEELISFNRRSVTDFFEKHEKDINNINDVMVSIKVNGKVRPPVSIKAFLFAIVVDDGWKYILTSGKWGKVNETFLSVVNETLKRMNKDFLKINKKLFFKYDDEDDYINQLLLSGNWEKLHTKDIYVTENYPKTKKPKIELADAYNYFEKELYAVKLDKNYQTIIYAFDQANTAVKALINGKEYKLEHQLKDKKVTSNKIVEITKCKKYAVIIGFEQEYLIDAIEKGEFSLTMPDSLLFKLKVIASANYIVSQGLEFNLYVVPGYRK